MIKKIVGIVLIVALLPTGILAQDIPYEIEEKIKTIYAEKYPADYSMQKVLIENQIESYLFLENYTGADGVPWDIFEQIKTKYQKRYPYDFSMQKVLLQNQVKSYLDLNN